MSTDVVVTLNELLTWHRTYEDFHDILVDKVTESAFPDWNPDADDPPEVTITGYQITGISTPLSVVFTIEWESA